MNRPKAWILPAPMVSMRDETTRFLIFALTVVIGIVFVASGLMLLNQGRDVDPAYTQAGNSAVTRWTLDDRGGGPLAATRTAQKNQP